MVVLGDLCRGFSVASEKKSWDRSGDLTGECEQWTTGDEKSLAIALSNARASLAFKVSQQCVLAANMLDLAGASI